MNEHELAAYELTAAREAAYKLAAKEAEAEGLGDLVDQYETSTEDEHTAEGLSDYLYQYEEDDDES